MLEPVLIVEGQPRQDNDAKLCVDGQSNNIDARPAQICVAQYELGALVLRVEVQEGVILMECAVPRVCEENTMLDSVDLCHFCLLRDDVCGVKEDTASPHSPYKTSDELLVHSVSEIVELLFGWVTEVLPSVQHDVLVDLQAPLLDCCNCCCF